MSERMRESLSALLDDEADELEVQRVLARIGDDPELRRTWFRYAAARSVVAGHRLDHLNLDISGRVRDAIASEEAVAAPAGGRLGQRLLRPLASFAIAASVAAVVVVGGQQLAGVEGVSAEGGQAVAGSVSPVGLVNSLGATSVQASYGTQPLPVLQPATRTAYQELARQRMRKYGQEHAEQAALNSPHGLIPFARVPEIRE
jgi:sigma-E factor negative regulatory protein RseA